MFIGTIEVWVDGETSAESRYIMDTVLNHLPDPMRHECMYDFQVFTNELGSGVYSTFDEFGNYVYAYQKSPRLEHKRPGGFLLNIFGDNFGSYKDPLHILIKWLTRLAKRVYVEGGVFRFFDEVFSEDGDYVLRLDDRWSGIYQSDGWVNRLLRPRYKDLIEVRQSKGMKIYDYNPLYNEIHKDGGR